MHVKRQIAAIAIASLLCSTAAKASDSVYLGDCARAQQVKAQSTIDKLLVDKRYEGLQRSYFGEESDLKCDINVVTFYTLTRRSNTPQEVTYDVSRKDLDYGMIEDCVESETISGITGTVSFTTQLEAKGELCEVYILSDWKLNDPLNPDWKGNFANRVTIVGESAFVVRQSRYAPGRFRTPLSFTGAQ